MDVTIPELKEKIIEATKEVFAAMIFIEVESPEINGQSSEVGDSHLSSLLGLGGDIRGMLGVHCPDVVAQEITSSLLGMEVNSLDDDVKDAIGEIANMVAGSLKIYFSENQIDTELAIPTSVIGKSYRTSGLRGSEKLVVPFTCSTGEFWIELKYVLNK